ncbi:MAG: 23S rRNA (guanosine(2251)-2'-O)-methyltransferase RlmB [Candidatus Firestonebacteria bacterium]
MNPDHIVMGRQKALELVQVADRRIKKILISREYEKELTDILEIAKEKNLNLQYMPFKQMNKILHSAEHEGVMVETFPKHYVDVEDMLKYAEERGEKPLIIALDNVQDPHNLGAVLRTAEGCGAHGVIIPKSNSANVNETVDKVSTGATKFVPISRVVNLNNALNTLKERGVWIAGAEVDGRGTFYDLDMKMPLCLVFGSEGDGMRKSIKENCDYLVNIPMRGHLTSLNVSVSAALLMYEAVRQRYYIGKK